MYEPATNEPTSKSHVTELVTTALSQDSLSGLSEMLKTIALSVNGDGCILWEARPGSDFDSSPPKGRFFMLAGWFKDNWRLALDDLPLKSAVGRAVTTQQSVNIERLRDSREFLSHPILQTTPVKTFFCVPVNFLDGTKGALNVYRYLPVPLYESEQRIVEEQAVLVPSLYQTIRDRVSLRLIRKVDDILHEAETGQLDPKAISKTATKVCQKICDEVGSTFQCIETSIFLEDTLEAAGQYKLMSTTWTGPFDKPVYRKGRREGLTGWVLARNTPIKIFDLAQFKRDKPMIRLEYPGINWKDSLNFRKTVRDALKLSHIDEMPPLSFMAVPIGMGNRVLGVIRCCTAKQGPYYLADRELNLLKVVAAQVGRYWSNCLNRSEMHIENESWRGLVESVKRLNQFVHNELGSESPEELRIFAEALRVARSVIRGSEIMDVRLFDEGTNELYFAETFGKAWSKGTEQEIDQRRRRRFSVLGNPSSGGAHVFLTRKVYIVQGPDDPYYSETFPDTKRVIIAPISVEDEIFGVLDIRATHETPFPKHAEAIAELLGQQLGLYHYLAKSIGKMVRAEGDLKQNLAVLETLRRQQAQAFLDLEHQLKSPIIQAYARVQSVLREATDDKLRSNIGKIRGLCGKAMRVAMSAGLFAKMVQEEPIQTTLTPLTSGDIVRLTIETADDTQSIIGPERQIGFHVNRSSFDALHEKIWVDRNLLEQAVSALLDNAAKYSYPRTQVQIRGGITGSGRFHITVINKGLPIRLSDVRVCVERGWRGGLAQATTGEGSGLGLWIVDNIMKAHHGELIILPTDSANLTEVKLVFPSVQE